MEKRRHRNKRMIRKDFPLLLWAGFLTAILVVGLTLLAFYWMAIQRQADKEQTKYESLIQLTDRLTHRSPAIADRRDSVIRQLRFLVGPDHHRQAIINLIDGPADSLQHNRELLQLNATTQQLSASEKTRLNATRARLQTTMVVLTCVTLIIISFMTGVSLGELRHRYEAYRREKELSQMKSHFITVASHEFRTPLSSIQLSISLIEKYAARSDTDSILKQGKKVRGTIANLTTILEDFLSLEKLESGKIKAVFEQFDLPELCRELVEELQEIASTGQHLEYKPTGLLKLVNLDKNLLRNSIINLLTNAIKYSGEHSHIQLETEIDEGKVIIRVRDDGKGIPANLQKDIFTPFYRADVGSGIPGTGLGLSIVKKYAELMHGRISFYSNPGALTVFTMDFPVKS